MPRPIKVKLFMDAKPSELERQINAWLADLGSAAIIRPETAIAGSPPVIVVTRLVRAAGGELATARLFPARDDQPARQDSFRSPPITSLDACPGGIGWLRRCLMSLQKRTSRSGVERNAIDRCCRKRA
jgi:hypothetical protein